jgi:hypothetical protein
MGVGEPLEGRRFVFLKNVCMGDLTEIITSKQRPEAGAESSIVLQRPCVQEAGSTPHRGNVSTGSYGCTEGI